MKLSKLLGFISTTIVSTLAIATSANAELITSRGFNVSLNTNRFFPLINGDPKMSTYITNPEDGDQQFDFIGGYSNGWVIKHRTTGKCLNGYNKYEGAPINVSPCNPGHLDQAWHALDKGNGFLILRLSGTSFCVTVDSPVGNGSSVVLRNCNYYSANGTQDWRRNNGGSVNTYVVTNITPLYEHWIVSRKQDQQYPWRYAQLDAGHAFTALIRRDQENVKVYTNGFLTQDYNRNKGDWYAYHGYGFWPDGLRIDRGGCNANSTTDECGDVMRVLRGQAISQSGSAVRKARVSENRANWIHNNFNWAGCSYYPALGTTPVGLASNGGCNCLDYATRQWYLFSAQREREDLRPSNWQPTSPNNLVLLINELNRDGEFLDGGNTWQ